MHLDFFEIIGIENGAMAWKLLRSRMSGVPGITYEAHLGSRFQVQKFALLIPKLVSPYPLDSAHPGAGTTDYAGVLSKP